MALVKKLKVAQRAQSLFGGLDPISRKRESRNQLGELDSEYERRVQLGALGQLSRAERDYFNAAPSKERAYGVIADTRKKNKRRGVDTSKF